MLVRTRMQESPWASTVTVKGFASYMSLSMLYLLNGDAYNDCRGASRRAAVTVLACYLLRCSSQQGWVEAQEPVQRLLWHECPRRWVCSQWALSPTPSLSRGAGAARRCSTIRLVTPLQNQSSQLSCQLSSASQLLDHSRDIS